MLAAAAKWIANVKALGVMGGDIKIFRILVAVLHCDGKYAIMHI